MNVTSVFVPCSPHINQWFEDAASYDALRKRMISGDFSSLTPQDQAFILSYINHRALLLDAFTRKDEPFIKALTEAGADITVVDDEGDSIWNCMTPDLFLWFYEKNMVTSANGKPLLQFLLESRFDRFSWEFDEQWEEILFIFISKASVDDYCAVSEKHLRNLVEIVKTKKEAQKVISDAFIKMIREQPDKVIVIARKLLANIDNQELMMDLIALIATGFLEYSLVEQILTDPQIMFWILRNSKFFTELVKCWQSQGPLLNLIQTVGDFRFALYLSAILHTSNLNAAASLFSKIGDYRHMSHLEEEVRKSVVAHIVKLQENEKNTIWRAMGNEDCRYGDLLQMRELGFDPEWVDPVDRQTFLFTKNVSCIETQRKMETLGFKLHHIDIHGNNALEHLCKNFHESFFPTVKLLTALELKVGDSFPNVQKCRELFPDNHYLQAVLGICLLYPLKIMRTYMARNLSPEDADVLRTVVSKDPGLCVQLKKCLKLNSPVAQSQKRSFDEIDKESWKDRYHEADGKLLDKYIKDPYSKDRDLAFLATFWEGTVPSQYVCMIKESPIASLVIGAMMMQHGQLVEGKRRKPVSLSDLLCSSMKHDDMVHLNRYLFDHPEAMRLFVHDYFSAWGLFIYPGGSFKTNYGKNMHRMIKKMDVLLHLPTYMTDLPKWHRKLVKAFNKSAPAVPAETLRIPSDVAIRLLGRTVIVTTREGCEAYKFLRPGEKFSFFSQEHSVCSALQAVKGQFQSRIIEPAGVFAVKNLPDSLAPFEGQLGDRTYKVVFHYKAHPDTFVYLQEVLPEQYVEARRKTLHDAARLIRLGIYPDLAAMFHNHQQTRRYVLLVDLMVRLMRYESEASTYAFNPAGGAGRLEIPFAKTKYPNARLSGMTDWRDAALYYGCGRTIDRSIKDMGNTLDGNKGPAKAFYQMNGLSSVFLIDTIILAERQIGKGELQWQNPLLNEQLGRMIMEGFAYLFSSYSETSYPKALSFAVGCGIDWTLCAKQIAFWLDNGPNGYPHWMAQGKTPPGLYEQGIRCDVSMNGAGNFDPAHGFSTNGAQDIGVYNGPLALEQFEKAAYLFFNAVVLAEPLAPKPEPVRLHHNFGWYDMGLL